MLSSLFARWCRLHCLLVLSLPLASALFAVEAAADDAPAYLWSKRMGAGGNDYGEKFAVDHLGNMYVAGSVTGTADLNGDGDTADSGESAAGYGDQDIYISQFNAAGTCQWSKRLGGAAADYGYAVTTDSAGNVYVIAAVSGNADLNGDTDRLDIAETAGAGYGSYDIIFAAFSSAGGGLWAKRMGGAGLDYGIAAANDSSGNIYIAGYVTGNADLNGDGDTADTGESADYGASDAVLMSFSTGGGFRWAKRLGGTDADIIYGLGIAPNGSVYAAGATTGAADLNADGDQIDAGEAAAGFGSSDAFLTVFSSVGAHSWSKRLGGTDADHGMAAAVDSNGNAYIGGRVTNAADLNLDGDSTDAFESGSGFGGTDAFVSSFSSNGTFRWAKRLGGSAQDELLVLTVDPNRNVYLAGSVTGSVDLNGDSDAGDSAESGNPANGTDAFLSLFDASGLHIWSKRLTSSSSDSVSGLKADAGGYIYYCGTLTGGADLNGDGDLSDTGESAAGYGLADVFLSVWRRTYTIYGTITFDGAALSGVTINGGALGTRTTNGAGYYAFSGAAHGTAYTLTPSLYTYTFSPSVRTGNLTANAAADFTAARDSYTVSGRVTTAFGPLAGVTINGGPLGTRTTDSNGNYSFTGLTYGTSFTITPSKYPYTFVPDSVTNGATANITADFIVTDSDIDGVLDSQETVDGSDATDRGSNLPVLQTTVCAEWNGFLGGMWNVMEHVNMGGGSLNIESTLYSLAGQPQGIENFTVLPGAQFDLLVHAMTGWTLNSYGKACSTALNGGAGDLDGRMVYYKPIDQDGSAYQFAFAMPFLNGSMGTQFVPFNTYQPSLDPADADNLVTNWIQLTNLEDSEQGGRLIFYGQDGAQLAEISDVRLSGGARQDFSGHQFGPNLVGIIEWRPDNIAARFQLRNVRYFYDNPSGADSFDTAFQIEGMVGTGRQVAVPLDTANASAILEVANVTAARQGISVTVYRKNGEALQTYFLDLPAYGSQHIITDSLLGGDKGVAVIQGERSDGIIAVAMQYGRTPEQGLKYMYGIPARQPLGTILRSSYNTFLRQGCRLLLVNPTTNAITANVSMVRYDGSPMLTGKELSIPARGLVDYDLCANDHENVYGAVTVQPAARNTVIGSVLRLGHNDDYRFPTPLRQ